MALVKQEALDLTRILDKKCDICMGARMIACPLGRAAGGLLLGETAYINPNDDRTVSDQYYWRENTTVNGIEWLGLHRARAVLDPASFGLTWQSDYPERIINCDSASVYHEIMSDEWDADTFSYFTNNAVQPELPFDD
jgi:hypothetical protein